MASPPRPHPRNAVETRKRILKAAQLEFLQKGYSQTGVRSIAQTAGVASSLLMKYYGTKANLFRETLVTTLGPFILGEDDKPGYAELLVTAVTDAKRQVAAPAMIALSLGDDEARQVVAAVLKEYAIKPTTAWIGDPDAEARATCLLMLSIGFVIFSRHLDVSLEPTPDPAVARIMKELVSFLVCRTIPESAS